MKTATNHDKADWHLSANQQLAFKHGVRLDIKISEIILGRYLSFIMHLYYIIQFNDNKYLTLIQRNHYKK